MDTDCSRWDVVLQGGSWLLAGIMTLVTVGPAAAQSDVPTAPLALALVREMDDRGLDYFAAKDAQRAGRYVAVRRLGTSQLSLVSDQVDAPAAMDERLARSDYEGVYWALTTATRRKERFLVHDLGGLGLRASRKPGHAFDMVDQSEMHTSLDGDWLSQRMSSDDYDRMFRNGERLYGHALQVLMAALEAVPAAQHTQGSCSLGGPTHVVKRADEVKGEVLDVTYEARLGGMGASMTPGHRTCSGGSRGLDLDITRRRHVGHAWRAPALHAHQSRQACNEGSWPASLETPGPPLRWRASPGQQRSIAEDSDDAVPRYDNGDDMTWARHCRLYMPAPGRERHFDAPGGSIHRPTHSNDGSIIGNHDAAQLRELLHRAPQAPNDGVRLRRDVARYRV